MATRAAFAPARQVIASILFTTDFSACSEALLPFVCSLARKLNAELTLLHVVTPELLSTEPPLEMRFDAQAQRSMDELRRSDQLLGLRYRSRVVDGDIRDVISQMVRSDNVDLMITGTHGRGRVEKFLIGSTAERIFREAPCPVMTVGPAVTAELKRHFDFSRILLAVSAPPQRKPALQFAARLAAEYKSELLLMNAVRFRDAKEGAAEYARTRRAVLAMVPDGKEIVADALVSFGNAAEQIVAMAEQRNASVIVMGAHRPAPLTAHLMDTAYRVICHAPCPVITVGNAPPA